MSDNPKKEDETQLIGIDFNDFGNNSSNENVNSSEDDPIIKEISVPHTKIKKILQNQINSLKQLSNTWIKGDIR